MKASFKCENCLTETIISGEGPRHLGCQSCGCGDIKFTVDVVLSPISDKNPGDVFPSIEVKKGESFLGSHPLGRSWKLSFPIVEPVVREPLRIRRIGKTNEGFHGKL